MWDADKDPISWARTDWKFALDYSGATQMQILKEFMEDIIWHQFIPDQSILHGENTSDGNYKMAMVNHDQSKVLVYTPMGDTINLNFATGSNINYNSYWFNPRDGVKTKCVGKVEKNIIQFIPTSRGKGSDWILVIEKI